MKNPCVGGLLEYRFTKITPQQLFARGKKVFAERVELSLTSLTNSETLWMHHRMNSKHYVINEVSEKLSWNQAEHMSNVSGLKVTENGALGYF